MSSNDMWDGLPGRVAARVMARANRAAELEAIEILDPSPDDVVVAIGIGPGVGVEALARDVRVVVGIDPSDTMIATATRRCRAQVEAGAVELHVRAAHAIPLPNGAAQGAVAVNSIQLWDPLEQSIAEVARVLQPGGRLVSVTHEWAIERSCDLDVEAWGERMAAICADHGLGAAELSRARAERGRAIVFTVERGAC